MQLKDGQRVRVVKCPNDDPRHVGRVGRLADTRVRGTSFSVDFDGGGCFALRVIPVSKLPSDPSRSAPPTPRR